MKEQLTPRYDERGSWTHASDALADQMCPGRHFAQRGLPDTQSDDASTGSRIHAALADPGDTERLNGLSASERDIYDQCREVEKKKVLEFFPDGVPTGEERRMRAFREQRYWGEFDSPFGRVKHSARLDVVFRQGARALIVEYKTLPGDVPDSPKNLQLRDQMVLAWGNLVTLDEIGVVVVQPLVTQDPQICVYTQPDRVTAEKLMVERIIASNDPKSPRIAGDVQCKFCKAALAGTCMEYQKWATQMAPPAILGVLEIPIASWSPEQRAQVLNALKPFEKFAEQVKDFVKAGLQADPQFAPGWRLKPGSTKETITDPQKCFERFGSFGGSLDQFMGSVTIGKLKLKDALRTATGAKGKTLDKQFADLLTGIVKESQNAPSLVKEEE